VKKIVFSSVMALSLMSFSAFAETFAAYISDSNCGAKHSATTPNAKCVASCIGKGASAVAVVGDKVYKIADADKVKDFYGQKVQINGKLEGDTMQVETISKLGD
jgi:hypothetical protein